MDNIFKNFKLFENTGISAIDTIVIKNYKKNSLIVEEGDLCNFIACVFKGEVFIEKHSLSGELFVLNKLSKFTIIGAALLFSEINTFSYQVRANVDTSILFIYKIEINKLIQNNSQFSKNYISFLSNRINYFSDKLNLLNYKDVRSRLLIYLYNEIQKQKTTTLKITHTREQIGNIISITRPSVSRELQKMVKDNIIKIQDNTITIINLNIFDAIK